MESIDIYLPDINFRIKMLERYKEDVKKMLSETTIQYLKDNDRYIYIEYIVDNEEFLKMLNIIKNTDGKIHDSFKKQQHKEIFWNNLYYYLVDTEEYIGIKRNETDYKILVKENNNVSLNWIIRIIRELYLREKENLGFNFMHGTALEIDKKGVLLLGNSGSGKTTLAVKFMDNNAHKNFLSNDRILLNKDMIMDYFPQAVTYAMGTAKNNKNLDKYFKDTRILEKKKKIVYEEAENDIDCNTPLTVVTKIFNNTNLIARTKVHTILYPRLNKELEGVEVIPMEDKEKMQLLIETSFTPEDTESLRKPWLKKRNKSEEELLNIRAELIENLIRKVDIKKIRYGVKTKIEDILEVL
ncbi:MAG: hypothetical protein HFJ37_04315 [Clostridia bacterium]|nr:hypothetical protein [Clostridia bacterium]